MRCPKKKKNKREQTTNTHDNPQTPDWCFALLRGVGQQCRAARNKYEEKENRSKEEDVLIFRSDRVHSGSKQNLRCCTAFRLLIFVTLEEANEMRIRRSPSLTSKISWMFRGISATSRNRVLKKIREERKCFLRSARVEFYPMRFVTSDCRQSFVHKLIRSPLLRIDTTQPLTCGASSVYWSPINDNN